MDGYLHDEIDALVAVSLRDVGQITPITSSQLLSKSVEAPDFIFHTCCVMEASFRFTLMTMIVLDLAIMLLFFWSFCTSDFFPLAFVYSK